MRKVFSIHKSLLDEQINITVYWWTFMDTYLNSYNLDTHWFLSKFNWGSHSIQSLKTSVHVATYFYVTTFDFLIKFSFNVFSCNKRKSVSLFWKQNVSSSCIYDFVIHQRCMDKYWLGFLFVCKFIIFYITMFTTT